MQRPPSYARVHPCFVPWTIAWPADSGEAGGRRALESRLITFEDILRKVRDAVHILGAASFYVDSRT